MSPLHSPFKFLDSYQEADADVFFGREKLTSDLYAALSGIKHLLVYGPSGSGKTSLVECGLRNRFSDADWFALTIRKGANINASVFSAINNSLHKKIETDSISKLPVDTTLEFGQAVELLFKERFQPVYLLFDQFEELLISGDAEEKTGFFSLLNKLIHDKVPCRIMLIMREEFIGHLSEFEPLCPSILQQRFRVEKMGRKNVEEVIYHILEAPAYRSFFNVDDSHKLAESILSKLPDKKKEIELAHVQVFLGELWDRAQSLTKDNELPLLSSSLVRDDDNLEGILESFLKKQMTELEASYGERVPLELLAAMISERFTKLQLSEAAIKADLENKKVISKKTIAELLKELEQRRIIRTIKIGDETQYEISHDVLALVVGQNLTEEMKMREKAEDIYKVYQERQGLFSQDDIDYLRPFQQSLSYPPDLQVRIDESIAAIKKQREQEQARTRKRLRTLYSLLGAAALALIVAMYFWFNANKQTKIAEEKTKIAQTNYLISEAKGLVETDPTLALRLAQHAMLIQKNEDFENVANKIYAENSFYKIVGRHTDIVSSVAFSPDGKTLLTGSWDNTARLWDLKGNLIQEFKGHTGQVLSVAFSPDGKTILTGSNDQTAVLWNLKGNPIQEFRGHTGPIFCVAFSPDGKTIFTGSWGQTVAILWDLSGNPIQEFIGHASSVSSVAFSPDGKTILTGSYDDKSALLWDLMGNPIQEFKDHTDGVLSVAFSPDGKTLLTSSGRTMRLWGLNGKMKQEFIGRSGFIISAAFSPDGKTILTGSEAEEAELWGLDGKIRQEFKGHTGQVVSVAFSPDGKTIVTGSEDKTARLWNLDDKMKQEFKGHTGYVYSVTFSPDGKSILTGSIDKTARLWDLKGNTIQEFKGHTARLSSVVFSPDGKTILTGSDDGTARLWDLKGNTMQEFIGHAYSVSSVAFSPDGKTILTGSADQTARLWDLKGNNIQEFKGDTNILSVAFSPDGKTILTGSGKTARLWDLRGNTIQKFPGHTEEVNSVAFSPDGKTLLTASGKTARLWGLDGKMKMEFIGNSKLISSVCFSPDGKEILTGSGDKMAILWGLNGKMKMEFIGHSEYLNSVGFSPDGKTILTGAGDNTARLWDTNFIPLVDFLKNDEIEPLSQEQKKKYGIIDPLTPVHQKTKGNQKK